MLIGTLEVIAGPMFAGKTSALLKKARSFKGEMMLIKPSFDTRYGICEIKTHDGVAAKAFNLSNTNEILNSPILEEVEAIFFDEIQFFTEPYFGGDIISCIKTLRDRGFLVVCCGLDMNWKGEEFDIISRLKQIANYNTSLHARCSICNEKASYTYKLSGKLSGTDSNIELGAEDLYEPRCSKHYPFSPDYEGDGQKYDNQEEQTSLFSF